MAEAPSLQDILDRLKQTDDDGRKRTDFERDCLRWAKNVDRRYAFVVLAALFLLMVAVMGSYRMYGLIFAEVVEKGVYNRQEALWPAAMSLTVQNIVGPFVSIIAYNTSSRVCIFIGGCLMVLANGLTSLSGKLVLDVLLIGLVQGISYAFIITPYMDVVNNYFLKYRALALGISQSGGNLSVFIWTPVFCWIMANYHWRTGYLGIALVGLLIIISSPFLRPNPIPDTRRLACNKLGNDQLDEQFNSQQTAQSLGQRIRRASIMALTADQSRMASSVAGLLSGQVVEVSGPVLDRRVSVISTNPFSGNIGIQRRMSQAIAKVGHTSPSSGDLKKMMQRKPSCAIGHRLSIIESHLNEQQNTNNVQLDEEELVQSFSFKIIINILKTPSFHLIWLTLLTFYWVMTVFSLVLVDLGMDHECSKEQAVNLVSFQSAGELIGRLVLTALLDLQLLSNRLTTALVLFLLATILSVLSCVSGYIGMIMIAMSLGALCSLLFILMNGLLIESLGEHQVTLGFGLASFVTGALLAPRPHAVGYFRDQIGSYDYLMICLAAGCVTCALLWILEPVISKLKEN